MIGRVVDRRYHVRSYLARGSTSTVYVAHDRRLDRLVALKIMHGYLADSPQFVARFRREARAAARLSHPSVVAIHDQGTLDDTTYLVMELIQGPNLRTILGERGPMSLGGALATAIQIADALAAAHRAGIVHRDIKPENVLLAPVAGEASKVKVADFGLARAVAEGTMATSGTVFGTVAYMAPEIFTSASADSRADVYALGIMLYELILGIVPYVAETPIAVAYQHINDSITPPSQIQSWIPDSIDRVIAAMTERDPQLRPADGSAASSLLMSALAEIPDATLSKRAPRELMDTWEKHVEEAGESEASRARVAASISEGKPTSVLPISTPPAGSGPRHARDIPPPPVRPTSRTTVPHGATIEVPAAAARSGILRPTAPLHTDDLSPAAGDSTSRAVSYTPRQRQVDDPDVDSEQPRRKRGRVFLLFLSMLVLLAAIGSGTWWWWNTYGPGSMVEIPSVSEMSLEEAQATLAELKLESVTDEEYSDTVPENHIISTQPTAGERVGKESTIKLIVSLGVEHVQVPPLPSGERATMEETLKKARLTLGEVSEDWSDDVAAGQIISVSPAIGEFVPHDSKVDVVLSKGPEPVEIPDLTGLTLAEAQAKLDALGLKYTSSEEYSASVEKGAIISQDPGASTGHRGDTVTMRVSLGPRMVTVPNVVSKGKSTARQILEAAGFKVETRSGILNLFGLVSKQEPAAGRLAPEGSVIVLTID